MNKRARTMTVCERIQWCKECQQITTSRRPHKCGYFYCSTCRREVPKDDHQCYIWPIDDADECDEEEKLGKKKKNQKNKRKKVFIFFDFETSQEKDAGKNEFGPIKKHDVNCCVAHRVCDACCDGDLTSCDKCGGTNRHIFMGPDALNQFARWLFSSENCGAMAIAHNACGFDAQFLLNYLHSQRTVKPKVITKGLELMMIEAAGVRVIDSLNFIPAPLSALPKTFDIPELKKGYFPHYFNTAKNWNYIGPLPDQEFYGPEYMKPEDREKFLAWYEQEKAKNKQFNFQEELLSYCESDVDIL